MQQTLHLFSINYVHAINVTKQYTDSVARNPILKHSIDTQFIIGSNYSFTVNPFANEAFATGTGFYFEGLADFSGNLAGLLVPTDPATGEKRLFGAAISQYMKAQTDLRYYLQFSKKSPFGQQADSWFRISLRKLQATSLYQTIFYRRKQ